MTALALLLGAAVLWLAYAFATAPEGWEDAEGWHAGREPIVPPHSGRSQ